MKWYVYTLIYLGLIFLFQVFCSAIEDYSVISSQELSKLKFERIFIQISFSIKDISIYIALLRLMYV